MYIQIEHKLTSSSIKIGAFLSRALAIATLCRLKTKCQQLFVTLSLTLTQITNLLSYLPLAPAK